MFLKFFSFYPNNHKMYKRFQWYVSCLKTFHLHNNRKENNVHNLFTFVSDKISIKFKKWHKHAIEIYGKRTNFPLLPRRKVLQCNSYFERSTLLFLYYFLYFHKNISKATVNFNFLPCLFLKYFSYLSILYICKNTVLFQILLFTDI